jgi:hypothetical protein
MPPRLVGETVQERKKCLAKLVLEHFKSSGIDHDASIVENRVNSAGHRDLVLVHSQKLGLIHVTAIGNTPQDTPLPFFREEGDQDWLVEKTLVAFGWVDRDDRTLIFFVNAEFVRKNPKLTKRMILANRDTTLSVTLPALKHEP